MKNVLLFFAILGATLAGRAQEMPENAPKTALQFEKTTIDYGVIAQGADGVRTFKFKNTGAHTLYIYQVFSTAHCKILSKPKEGIAPGNEGEIKIQYDTTVKGKIVRTLTVKANIPEGIIPLNITGVVQ